MPLSSDGAVPLVRACPGLRRQLSRMIRLFRTRPQTLPWENYTQQLSFCVFIAWVCKAWKKMAIQRMLQCQVCGSWSEGREKSPRFRKFSMMQRAETNVSPDTPLTLGAAVRQCADTCLMYSSFLRHPHASSSFNTAHTEFHLFIEFQSKGHWVYLWDMK